MARYCSPQSIEEYPRGIDDDTYTLEDLHEIVDYRKNHMREDSDIFVHFDEDADLDALPSTLVYNGQYFGDDGGLYGYTDDQWDYPRGIDDDEDPYAYDPDLHAIFEDDGLAPGCNDRQGASPGQDVQMAVEREIFNARYFDPTDIYEYAYCHFPVFHEEEETSSSDDSESSDSQTRIIGRKTRRMVSSPRAVNIRKEDRDGWPDTVDSEAWNVDNGDIIEWYEEKASPEECQRSGSQPHSSRSAKSWPWSLPSPDGTSFLDAGHDEWRSYLQ